LLGAGGAAGAPFASSTLPARKYGCVKCTAPAPVEQAAAAPPAAEPAAGQATAQASAAGSAAVAVEQAAEQAEEAEETVAAEEAMEQEATMDREGAVAELVLTPMLSHSGLFQRLPWRPT